VTSKATGANRDAPGKPQDALLGLIRDSVREIEPEARIILYGSRARGDAEPDSDWDLLVLLNGPVEHERASAVMHRLYDLQLVLEECPVLSVIVRTKEEWASPVYQAMPFHENVEREGIEL
jgi:uncharacterized protein